MAKRVKCGVCCGMGMTIPEHHGGMVVPLKCKHCNGTGRIEVPETNADRIRAMSDEELAEVLAFGLGCLLKAPHCMDTDCRPCYLKWLKQPAE